MKRSGTVYVIVAYIFSAETGEIREKTLLEDSRD